MPRVYSYRLQIAQTGTLGDSMQTCPNQVIYLRQQRQTYDLKVGSSYRDRKAAEAVTLLSEGGIMARKGKRVLLSMIRG